MAKPNPNQNKPNKQDERELLILIALRPEGLLVRPLLDMLEITGRINRKRACYILNKFYLWDWYSYGINLELGWLTPEGQARADALIAEAKPESVEYLKAAIKLLAVKYIGEERARDKAMLDRPGRNPESDYLYPGGKSPFLILPVPPPGTLPRCVQCGGCEEDAYAACQYKHEYAPRLCPAIVLEPVI